MLGDMTVFYRLSDAKKMCDEANDFAFEKFGQIAEEGIERKVDTRLAVFTLFLLSFRFLQEEGVPDKSLRDELLTTWWDTDDGSPAFPWVEEFLVSSGILLP